MFDNAPMVEKWQGWCSIWKKYLHWDERLVQYESHQRVIYVFRVLLSFTTGYFTVTKQCSALQLIIFMVTKELRKQYHASFAVYPTYLTMITAINILRTTSRTLRFSKTACLKQRCPFSSVNKKTSYDFQMAQMLMAISTCWRKSACVFQKLFMRNCILSAYGI